MLDGAPERLLDLYDLQRRTVAIEFVQEQSIANKKRLEASDPEVRKRNLDELRADGGGPGTRAGVPAAHRNDCQPTSRGGVRIDGGLSERTCGRQSSHAAPIWRMPRNSPRAPKRPRDFLEACLADLNTWEPKVGAFVNLRIEGARQDADRATVRWRAGAPLSPIDGMPIGIKDIIETADMPTEMGSPLFAGWRSQKDAASVAALRQAGAVILGKTVTTEFAASEPRGTRNPWNLEHTPGGSSSGSAAAVAAGIISAGLGTQVIGSTIRPASFCGCIGFKPTIGALNREGSHDYQSQSCTGILAATLPMLGRSLTRSHSASAAMLARPA